MSVNSMTNAAIARRTDFPPLNKAPQGRQQIASAAAGSDTPQSGVTAALAVIVTYIPTEVLTVYVAVLAAFSASTTAPRTNWTIFAIFLVATPLTVWAIYAAKVKSANGTLPRWSQLPVWEMAAGTLAFVAWALSLPSAPFLSYAGLPATLGSVVILVVSALLGLLAPLFQKTIQS